MSENALRTELAQEPIRHSGGIVAMPQGPGLGLEIDREVLQNYCSPPPAPDDNKPEEIPHQRATRGRRPAPQCQQATLRVSAHAACARARRRQRLARKIRVQSREHQRRTRRGDVRFALDHIQACPRKARRSQRLDQGRGLDHRPASDVDDIALRPQRREHVRVDEMAVPAPPGAAQIRQSAHVASSMRRSKER